MRSSLAVQWLGLCVCLLQGGWVRPLVGELRSHMPHGAVKKKIKLDIEINIELHLKAVATVLNVL